MLKHQIGGRARTGVVASHVCTERRRGEGLKKAGGKAALSRLWAQFQRQIIVFSAMNING
jgi:hypothetical protein